jgi:hypothetical protein
LTRPETGSLRLEDQVAQNVAESPDALQFTSPGGLPLRRTKFRPRWAAACAQAGVSGLHVHDLRGSGATWAAHQGATLAELMQRLGHRSHTAALRYQHATSERGREIADGTWCPHARRADNGAGGHCRSASDGLLSAPFEVAIPRLFHASVVGIRGIGNRDEK